MANLVPPVTDERGGLLAFLTQARDNLRRTVHGPTDEQARTRSTASDLSLLALLRHASRTERRWIVAGMAGRPLPGLWPITDWDTEFVLTDEDTISRWLEHYSETAAITESIVAEIEDLNQPCVSEQAQHWSARWVLLHVLQETAQHAGHADIIRESLDGAKASDLMSGAYSPRTVPVQQAVIPIRSAGSIQTSRNSPPSGSGTLSGCCW
jgi:Protein of unknown function (DUF664)